MKTPLKGDMMKVSFQVVTLFEGQKVGLFKKHVIVKVREGTVKGSVKLFRACSKSMYS